MKNLPRVSYVKAMDVFMLASTFFIFASLIELAIVSYSSKAWAKIHEKEGKDDNNDDGSGYGAKPDSNSIAHPPPPPPALPPLRARSLTRLGRSPKPSQLVRKAFTALEPSSPFGRRSSLNSFNSGHTSLMWGR